MAEHNLKMTILGSRPQFKGVREGSYHNFGDNDNSSNAFSGNDFDRYSANGTRASDSYEYDQSSDRRNIEYRGFGYIGMMLNPNSL